MKVRGHDRHVLAGFKVVDDHSIERMVTVRPLFKLTGGFTMRSMSLPYEAESSLLPTIEPYCPAWHLFASISTFTGMMGSAQTGQRSVPRYIPETYDLLGQNLRLQGRSNVVGKVTAIGRPIEISDWSGQTLRVTETIELTPVTGAGDVSGRVGGVFETIKDLPVGSLISRSNDAWYLAPILPYLEWGEQKYCDPVLSCRKQFVETQKNAPLLYDFGRRVA